VEFIPNTAPISVYRGIISYPFLHCLFPWVSNNKNISVIYSVMRTRKNKKSNKRFRRTRSKRQRGGTIYDDINLIEASKEGNIKTVEELLAKKGIDVNARNRYGNTPLQMAAGRGHVKIVEMLLKEGADVNAQNMYDVSVLQSIVIGRNEDQFIEIMKMLLEHPEIKVNVKDGDGVTPLYRACRNGHTTLIEMLLEAGAGAEVNAKWTGTLENGWTALIQAFTNTPPFDIKIVKMLLENGADVDTTRPDDGWTVLQWASEYGYEEIVKMLLERGVNVHAKDNYDNTALDIANERGQTRIVDILTAAINEEKKIKGHKQEAMELVRHSDVKIPSLRALAFNELSTDETSKVNLKKNEMLPPKNVFKTPKGGKRKTKTNKRKKRKSRKNKRK